MPSTSNAPWSGCLACGAPSSSCPSNSPRSCTQPARRRSLPGNAASSSSTWRRAASPATAPAGWPPSRPRPADALAARGQATAAELASDVAGLREQLNFGAGKKWAGSVGVSTRVLFLLAADGVIVRGRPRGSWLSTQYRWAPMHAWLPGGLPSLPVAQARAELVRRWLAAYGPGTPADIAWWTGWTAGEVKQALARVPNARCGPRRGDRPPAPTTTAMRAATSRPRRRRPRRRGPRLGPRCCPPWTRPSWAGQAGTGSSASTDRRCLTARETPGRRCGGTVAWSAGGHSGATVRSRSGCWKTSARTHGRRSAAPPPGCRHGSVRCG